MVILARIDSEQFIADRCTRSDLYFPLEIGGPTGPLEYAEHMSRTEAACYYWLRSERPSMSVSSDGVVGSSNLTETLEL